MKLSYSHLPIQMLIWASVATIEPFGPSRGTAMPGKCRECNPTPRRPYLACHPGEG